MSFKSPSVDFWSGTITHFDTTLVSDEEEVEKAVGQGIFLEILTWLSLSLLCLYVGLRVRSEDRDRVGNGIYSKFMR